MRPAQAPLPAWPATGTAARPEDSAAPQPVAGAYRPLRAGSCRDVAVRGLAMRLMQWGEPTGDTPLLVMLHGFMDAGASFQFVVDAWAGLPGGHRAIVAPDWRGFGASAGLAGADAYWFPDYLGDLDALLDLLSPQAPVDLLGHSMGGNVAMVYAGVRPHRVRRLVNLEGFGLPDMPAADAPERLAQWLDELKTPQRLKPYPHFAELCTRLQRQNPRLPADKAAWLAQHWAQPCDASAPEGAWRLRADPAHRRINPVPYRAAEAVATWSRIRAPVLWVQGADSRIEAFWNGRYTQEEFQARLAQVPTLRQRMLPDAGHMLHHDQPEALARELAEFFGDAC